MKRAPAIICKYAIGAYPYAIINICRPWLPPDGCWQAGLNPVLPSRTHLIIICMAHKLPASLPELLERPDQTFWRLWAVIPRTSNPPNLHKSQLPALSGYSFYKTSSPPTHDTITITTLAIQMKWYNVSMTWWFYFSHWDLTLLEWNIQRLSLPMVMAIPGKKDWCQAFFSDRHQIKRTNKARNTF